MRRAMRECPANDGCLARDRSRRPFNLISDVAHAAAASAYRANVASYESIDPRPIHPSLRFHDAAIRDRHGFPTGGHQLPADESHTAPSAYPVHGLVQADRAAAGA